MVLPAAFLLTLFISLGQSQTDFKVCGRKLSTDCQSLERGDSVVQCTDTTDSIDCLLRMEEGKADFTLLTSEEVMLAAMTKSEYFDVLASVRQEEKRNQKYAFQSVALVKNSHIGGLAGLKGGRLCHPGYGKAKEQLWSDRVLKYFEKKTASASRDCQPNSESSAEDDGNDLVNFFTSACRPGPWVVDPAEDKKLKDKFPSLCSLCTSNGRPDCDGYRYFEPRAVAGAGVNSHLSAIECLTSQRGTVAYVAYHHVNEYFKPNAIEINDYALLCEDGTLVALNTVSNSLEAPCAWISQPWGAIVSRKQVSTDLSTNLKTWLPQGRSSGSDTWQASLDAILFREKTEVLEYPLNQITLTDYVAPGRPVPPIEVKQCHDAVKWCTVNAMEHHKCSWIQAAASTLGMQPNIQCVQGVSHLDCLEKVRQGGADFLSIDSNLGFLARKYYNVTAILYHETSKAMSSKVFALIKESSKNQITRFENLKDKNACFPEYGGIGWVAFMRTAHERRVISSNECDYASEVVNFFSASCAPGAADSAHYPSKAADPAKLCTACTGFSPRGGNEQGIVQRGTFLGPPQVCPADSSNKFYGNKGALVCLAEVDSHVAFLEGQNLKRHIKQLSVQPENFRVMCRNGSLAGYPGFDVDDECALSVTIDSEIVAKRGDRNTKNLQLLLQEIDNWFGYNSGSFKLINLEAFSPFNGTKDLLFKDSTVGLATSLSENKLVFNYIDLFKHVETCTGGAMNVVLPSILTLIMVFVTTKILQSS
ncbi:transferrin-like [Arctopsyche grandis]|uniref:transferrin-like n=1 Tax=Arctopsyche grandis TaxID=121162 RepID=UPI00406DA4E1